MQRNWVVLGAVVLLVAIAGCSGITGDDGGSGTPDWCGTGQVSAEQFQAGGGEVSVNVEGVVERNGEDQCKITYDLSDAQMSTYSTLEVYFNQDFSTYEGIYYDQNGNQVATFDLSGMGASTGGDTGGTVTTTTSGGDDGMFGDSGGDDGGVTATTGGSDTGGTDVSDIQDISGTMTYGQSVQGHLDESGPIVPGRDQPAEVYVFQGSAGDSVRITQNSGPIDPYLTLVGPNGQVVAENDDFNGLNSRIDTTLQSNGQYYIFASRYSGQGFFGDPTGPFTLTLERT